MFGCVKEERSHLAGVATCRAPFSRAVRVVAAALALSGGMYCAPACAATASSPPDTKSVAPASAGGTIDRRIDLLARALGLDSRQQMEMRRILQNQRQAIAKIWTDSALQPSERGPATRAIEEHTADQIRSMLTDQQKKRYNPPKPQVAPSAAPNVDAWMRIQAGHAE